MKKYSAAVSLFILVSSALALAEPVVWEGAAGGGRMALAFPEEGICRVRWTKRAAFGEQANATGVCVARGDGAKCEVEESSGGVRAATASLAVTLDKATGRVVFADAATGRVLLAEKAALPHEGESVATEKVTYDESSAEVVHTANGDITVRREAGRVKGEEAWRYRVRFDWREGEALYGLGSHLAGRLNLRGREVFLVQHNLKACVPVIVSTGGYGLLFDAGSAMRFCDKGGDGLVEINAADELDYYFIRGDRLDDAVAGYRRLTGEAPMMPKYLFGYVQSKERYRSSEEVLSVVRRYRELGVPLDLVVQDWNYWPQGWGYMKMNPRAYPDPAALAKGVHELGAKLMVSIWPNPQKCPQEKEFRDAGHLLANNVYDAFSAEARAHYWRWADREFFSNGFDSWWCDCSEPLDADWKAMPEGYGFASEAERYAKNDDLLSATLGPKRASLFSLYHARGIYENQRAATDAKRVVNLTRSSYAGQQRYSTITWNGDTSAGWQSFKRQIPEGLAFMAAGCPYWTVDAGGFFVKSRPDLWFWRGEFPAGAASPAYREYYVRMLQWAAYLPVMRSHGTDTPREIWNFGKRGEKYFDAIEKAIGERYELLPYTYSLAAKVTREGYTMARLLAFDFPEDEAVRDMGDEYMFGPSLLVCPVTEPGSATRRVYLPAGATWYDRRTGRREEGGRWIDAPAPLDAIPVFARAGAIVPTIAKMQYVDEVANPETTLTVYPGADGAFTLYDDAGDGYGCEKGEFCVIPLVWDDAKRALSIGARVGAYPGMSARRVFKVRSIDGGSVEVEYDGSALEVRLERAPFAPAWASLESSYKVPAWFEDAKFGIFCHWGVQCAAEAGDWYARNMYGDPAKGQAKHHRDNYGDPKEFGFKDFIPLWKAEKWNPDGLCALYRKMGARYIVAMANHHDNFDNWASPLQPWNSVNMGPKRDILDEWSKAAASHGLRFGVSFHASHAWTWYEPARDYDGLLTAADGAGTWWQGYEPQQLYCQNHAPSRNYRDLGSMWKRWDWGAGASLPSAQFVENVKARMMDAIVKYKPDIVYFDDTVLPFWPLEDGRAGLEVVSRFYNENMKLHSGRLEAVATGKILSESQRRALVWDVERGTPQKPMFPHWQTCSCIGVWHYDRGVYDANRYKDAKTVLRILADVVSKNGNLLLSIPIRGDGSIDEKERAICEDIAAWMAVNGEAIFGTVPWKVCGEGPQLAATPPLQGPGFNEGRIPRPTENDIRYTASKDGSTVYAIVLVPPGDGASPACEELAKAGFSVAERLGQVKDMPAVWRFTRR